jgi:hypothetical protein
MKRFMIPALVTLIGAVCALFLASRFPAVEGLGTKVRLPVYHGAMTWATLIAFAILFIAALWYLFSATDRAWRLDSGFRWAVVIVWAIGTILGFVAAYNTWDFSASQTPVALIMREDPRLIAQIVILCLGIILLVLPMVTENRRARSIADIGFVVLAGALLAWAMNAGRALHPDSPIMNSSEIAIKLLFFMMVASHLIAVVGLASICAQATRDKE